jgi:hypothetical protein
MDPAGGNMRRGGQSALIIPVMVVGAYVFAVYIT